MRSERDKTHKEVVSGWCVPTRPSAPSRVSLPRVHHWPACCRLVRTQFCFIPRRVAISADVFSCRRVSTRQNVTFAFTPPYLFIISTATITHKGLRVYYCVTIAISHGRVRSSKVAAGVSVRVPIGCTISSLQTSADSVQSAIRLTRHVQYPLVASQSQVVHQRGIFSTS